MADAAKTTTGRHNVPSSQRVAISMFLYPKYNVGSVKHPLHEPCLTGFPAFCFSDFPLMLLRGNRRIGVRSGENPA